MRFRLPRSRPTSEAAHGRPELEPAQDPATVPGPADQVDPAVTATASRPSPTARRPRPRPRPRPLPSPRPEVDAGEAATEPDDDIEDDEYWDDEYEDDYYAEDEYAEDDEYWDDEYEDDYLDEDEYADDLEDEYEDDLGDEDYEDETGEDAELGAERRRRRLLGRLRKERGRRPGRLRRRGRAGAGDDLSVEPPEPTPEDQVPAARPRPRPAPMPVGADGDEATGLPLPGVEPDLDDGIGDEADDAAAAASRRRRLPRVPRVPVAAMRASTARAWSGTRSGFHRGWTATRKGVVATAHFLRTHWGRAAYIYLAFVGVALLITVLLYWHSGFTYDECNYCGMPVLATVSPWWLLILPFNVSQWPLLSPLFVILLFAGLNAELFDRWSKRPEPEYPDWD